MFADLTADQIKIILKHHKFLEDLANGVRHPKTDAQKQFVRVVRGDAKASTDFEVAYGAWKRSGLSLFVLKKELEKTGQRNAASKPTVAKGSEKPERRGKKLSDRARKVGAGQPATTIFEDTQEKNTPKVERDKIPNAGLAPKPNHYARKISEPWGSREGFRRDRASWKKGGA